MTIRRVCILFFEVLLFTFRTVGCYFESSKNVFCRSLNSIFIALYQWFTSYLRLQKLNWIAKENAGSQKIAKLPENRLYNRYRDVLPCKLSFPFFTVSSSSSTFSCLNIFDTTRCILIFPLFSSWPQQSSAEGRGDWLH